MADYLFLAHETPRPADVAPFYQAGFLFNNVAHWQTQADTFVYHVAVNAGDVADARCAFAVQHNVAVSPAAAPFGSVEFGAIFPDDALTTFLERIETDARHRGATSLRLVHHPSIYQPDAVARLLPLLQQRGFAVNEQTTYVLDVANVAFDAGLHPSEGRRLEKAQRAGLRFAEFVGSAEDVVNFIQQSRQRQDYPLTLRPDMLLRLLTDFPDDFRPFAVYDGNVVATLTVAVRVRADIWYNFLPADNVAYRPFSPAVLLTAGLFDYVKTRRARLLDLGLSLDAAGQPKPSLATFKARLGAQPSPKLTFTKAL